MKHIVCFHLFNDYSGSPKVLAIILKELLNNNSRIDLITSKGGILDTLNTNKHLNIYYYKYKFSNHAVITTLRYIWVQIYTFIYSFRYLFAKDTIFYINTLLPVGPALAGRLMGKLVIYHYHENALIKGCFYKSLSWIMQRLAHKIICVSAYQSSFLKRKKEVIVVPNALSSNFNKALEDITVRELSEEKIVLMLSSLKIYKGILEFIKLAEYLPHYTFNLVVNDTMDDINAFALRNTITIPSNLCIYDRQSDIIPFYRQATIVLNLSDKNSFIETFGLTVLEAMTAALPVIVPTEGGIAEMVEDGVNGYKIDAQNLDDIRFYIDKIFNDPKLYHALSINAKQMSKLYDINRICEKILSLFIQNI